MRHPTIDGKPLVSTLRRGSKVIWSIVAFAAALPRRCDGRRLCVRVGNLPAAAALAYPGDSTASEMLAARPVGLARGVRAHARDCGESHR